ncbi:MAG: DedA family protein [Bdellovibrionales bacterium]|nr:DedA family protein [Bdellovibrionales bacterium]
MENSGLSTTLLTYFASLSGLGAYSAILGVLLACGLGVPIPEDITLIAAGILAGMGKISVFGAYTVGCFGVLAGDAFLFFVGRKFGRRVFHWPLFSRIFTPERIGQAEDRIQKNAKLVCFVARFLPGLRAPIYLTAGILKVRPSVFMLQDSLAALLSVPIWVFLGHKVGEDFDLAIKLAKEFQIVILVVVAVIVCLYFVRRYFKKKRSKNALDQS